ncbi:MAG: hypothetical protein ABII26_00305 [Pseudomonadota bacterium]
MASLKWIMIFVYAAVLFWPVISADARIKLAALPERSVTILRLDNPQATLIEEERVLALQRGTNKVDFSWKGVSIDPDSIRLRFLSHPKDVTLINVSYPPNEGALVWEIASTGAWEESVRVSYLLSNIDRLITYTALADKNETEVNLKSHLVLRNFSGEDFDGARVLLDYGDPFKTDIRHEETKQMLLLVARRVPIVKTWKWDSALQPWDPEKISQNVGIPVSYTIKNITNHGLGKFALWGGKVRVQQEDGHNSIIFLGEDSTALIPTGEKMEVYIGDSRDIVVTQRKMMDKKINIRRNNQNQIVLHDTDELIRAEIENFKDSKARLTVIQHIPGQWDMEECNMKYKRRDASALEFEIDLPPRGKGQLIMHYHRRNLR